MTEARVLGGDDEVAHHGELAAASQGESGDRRDNGLAAAGRLVPGRELFFEVPVDEAPRLHFLDVRSRGEGFLAAGYDNGANGVVGFKSFQCVGKLVNERTVQRVQRFGSIERNDADAVRFLDQDVFVAHD